MKITIINSTIEFLAVKKTKINVEAMTPHSYYSSGHYVSGGAWALYVVGDTIASGSTPSIAGSTSILYPYVSTYVDVHVGDKITVHAKKASGVTWDNYISYFIIDENNVIKYLGRLNSDNNSLQELSYTCEFEGTLLFNSDYDADCDVEILRA